MSKDAGSSGKLVGGFAVAVECKVSQTIVAEDHPATDVFQLKLCNVEIELCIGVTDTIAASFFVQLGTSEVNLLRVDIEALTAGQARS